MWKMKGQYASIISTIVDSYKIYQDKKKGQYASIISTIVDIIMWFKN